MGDTRLEPVVLSEAERLTLESWAKRRSTAQGLAVPCPATGRTRRRAAAPDAQVEEVVVRTLEQMPQGGTHWSKRELAKVVGISPASVLRIWHAFGLQPWRTETFKISPDPFLIDKIRDVVGLHLAPPANAVVFAMDEKPQIQALERTAPVLPMIPGVPERRSFDYVRHGTVDLFAAEHRHGQGDHETVRPTPGRRLPRLPRRDRPQTDKSLAVHVICANLSAHKAPVAHKWLLAGRCLTRGVFCSLDDLKTALEEWIKVWNDDARHFKWTKTADQILDRICRYCDRISEPDH